MKDEAPSASVPGHEILKDNYSFEFIDKMITSQNGKILELNIKLQNHHFTKSTTMRRTVRSSFQQRGASRGSSAASASILHNNGRVARQTEDNVLLVLFLDGQIENVLLVTRGQTGEDGDHAEQTGLSAILLGIHGHEQSGQPSAKRLDANLKVIKARAHSSRHKVLVLKTSGTGLLRNEEILLGNIRATYLTQTTY